MAQSASARADEDDIWSDKVVEPELEFDESGIELAAIDALCQEESEDPHLRAGAITPDGLIDEDFEQELGSPDHIENEEDGEFKDISKYGIVQLAGDDNFGRKIVVISACKLPPRSVLDHAKLLSFLKKTLDQYVENDYSIVYFHFGFNRENKPSFAWLRQAYKEFDRRYKKNLKALYVVHPSRVIRFLWKLFQPIISAKFGKKVIHVEYLHDLAQYVQLSQLLIPKAVQEHDAKLLEKYKPVIKPMPIIQAPKFTQQFGVTLQYMKERNQNNVIPIVVSSTTEYLLNEGLSCQGIFRRSANVQSLTAVQKQIDNGEKIDYGSFNDPNLAAAVLKCFCRQLPKPLLTFDLYDYILQIQSSFPDDNKLPEVRRVLCDELPDDNYEVLKYIIRFLAKVAANSEVNAMNSHNLGIVFGPNLLWHCTTQPNPVSIQYINSFTAYLIANYEELFTK
ncbi:DgyrCDS5938 [Dimorphilus gyrociliatus]|uniref:DgyrCDS5938 n=1 Tax=Dimorphilus gyrociliatus TaxID=2664684 RepID=A0A7I8VN30_9ANNE|nr:DgyrCDS5938 [Dimorphilus gyrociliatus]